MPKVHHVKANKDYPAHGIKKGELYYHWAFFRGPKQMSKTPPRRSQITASPNLSDAYAAEEALEDALDGAATVEDVKEALTDAVEALETVLSEFSESISNLEQAFQGGCPALEEKQERHDAVESFKDELDQAANDVEAIDLTDFLDEETRRADWVQAQEAEHKDEEDWEVDEDAFELPESVVWDDLTEAERADALEEAKGLATASSLEI